MSHILDVLHDHVLLCDGAMGSQVQSLALDVEHSFWGKENCTEVLNLSRPDVIRTLHHQYFEAGADMVETNTFGGSPITLGEFDLHDRAFEINKRAAELAREAADSFHDGCSRFILGAVGPGTRLPSLGQVSYEVLEEAFTTQCRGLIAGPIDAFLIETCQDPLQAKAAINGAKNANRLSDTSLPIFVQVTIESSKTMLVGTDITAVVTIFQGLDIDLMGLNCATGPEEMAEPIKGLAERWKGLLSCQPNAGLPQLSDGQSWYPLTPEVLAQWLEHFIEVYSLNLIGGCCGTTAQHTRALDRMLRRHAPQGSVRPRCSQRTVHWIPSVASLYSPVPLRQENSCFLIGERCNANGSKRWRKLQEQHDWDGCIALAREQIAEGSNAIDVCTAFIGRNEIDEMSAVIQRFATILTVPLVIDTTEYDVLEKAILLYGGKPIINSINFEDGEHPVHCRLALARKFGCAVIALTIDEQGMAKTIDRKLAIAKRLYGLAVEEYHLPASDLLIDPLTFTIATGNEEDRQLGYWTLEGIKAISAEMPDCQIVLGVSNISFGLKPAARRVLNSVFLDQAMQCGLTGAIIDVSKILPLHQIPTKAVQVAQDLIYDRRRQDYDPLQDILTMFRNGQESHVTKKQQPQAIDERLKQRIIDGDLHDIERDLDHALRTFQPLDIINTILLDGMKVVGELFAAGKMQLPFVLRSAETMKKAVSYLEPFMVQSHTHIKGIIILATVKGDVHDIGKNLVDIILTNNSYRVINLGIKQTISQILEATQQHRADAIGMSGLLVKSTVVMRENLEELSRRNFKIPVLLGGAALTRDYVEQECTKSYSCGRVAYARNAFDGLWLMDKIIDGTFDAYLATLKTKHKPSRRSRKSLPESKPTRLDHEPIRLDHEQIQHRRASLSKDVEIPKPPFWGSTMINSVSLESLLPFLNERMLYQFHWGFRKDGKRLDEYRQWAKKELQPILNKMLDRVIQQNILLPQGIYGYWPCAAQGNDVIVFAEDGLSELVRFNFPRQQQENGICIADFFRDVTWHERDMIAFQVVTMGHYASEVAEEWFAAHHYQDYLYLHGLSVEMTEAMAEYVHARIRHELGFDHQDETDKETLLRQGYRGSRYSFGYPACPHLEDQKPLMQLLQADRIGVTLSEEYQLIPEQSTTALVVLHPQAKYFVI